MTDAPACGYDHVYVTVEKVRVHTSGSAGDSEGGWREVTVSPARRIDLLTLTNGVLEELGTTTLPAGNYSQVRLVLAENGGTSPTANAVQPTGGALTALSTPSGQQSGLKLQAHFNVQAGQTTDLVLDFDACKSIVRAGNSGRYSLKPVLSVVPRAASSIQGYVTTTLSLNSTTVSAQQAGTVIRSTVPDPTGKFTLAFLPPGSYDVVIASSGRSTAVITSVPVTTATAAVTSVSGTATAIAPPVSAMREVTGTASVSASGSSTAALATDAVVAARQAVASTTVEVGRTAVDSELASYRLNLPTAAPVRAPYATTLPLTFTPDLSVAGKYTLSATSGTRATSQSVDLSFGTGALTGNFVFAP